jgi:hypothetical protein
MFILKFIQGNEVGNFTASFVPSVEIWIMQTNKEVCCIYAVMLQNAVCASRMYY